MHKIGVHWIKTHGRPEDLQYVRDLQPRSIKLVSTSVPDVQWISDTYQAAPDALLVLRDWALSEQKSDMVNDPAGTGRRHAQEWRQHIEELRNEAGRRHIPFPPDNKLCVVGINEPEVWNHLQQTAAYTVAFLDECDKLGLTAGALNLSVGWPANSGPDTPPNWAPYAPILPAIVRGNHYLVLHEYWADQGPSERWGWWGGRYAKCPWDVPIIIGECGLDMYVKDAGRTPRGWQGNISAEQYHAHLQQYHEAVMQDPRIHSIQVYTTDFGHPWGSFDLAPLQPHLAAYANSVSIVVGPGVSLQRPGYVLATAGLNMRTQPSTTAPVNTTLRYGTEVIITGAQQGEWLPTLYQGVTGWLFAQYVGDTKPQFMIELDNFDRSIAFVLQEEGGYTPGLAGDRGGETNFGISRLAYPELDIANLTLPEAVAIYRRDYWTASNADRLAWPMCLVHLDTAVNLGVGAALDIMKESGGDPLRYLANRLERYAAMGNVGTFGKAWGARVGRLLIEVAK
jgi:uncharacterized protein YgiM (DUF1202 family)